MEVTYLKAICLVLESFFFSNFLSQLTLTFLQESAEPGLPLPTLPWPTHTLHFRERKLSEAP